MEFEWDEAKRLSNLQKHRIDFIDIQVSFDGRPRITIPGRSDDESRLKTTAILDSTFYTVIWTWRGDCIRIISARRARDAERRNYRSVHG